MNYIAVQPNLQSIRRMSYTQGYMDVQEDVKKIKIELADTIVKELQANQIDTQKAQHLASDFLAILPVQDYADLLQKLKALADAYTEVRPLYLEEMEKLNEQQRSDALTQIRSAIATGNMEDATTVANVIKNSDSIGGK